MAEDVLMPEFLIFFVRNHHLNEIILCYLKHFIDCSIINNFINEK